MLLALHALLSKATIFFTWGNTMIFLPRCAQFPFLMISSKLPTSPALQPGAHTPPPHLPPQCIFVISTLFFSPTTTKKKDEKARKNIHGDKYWNEFPLYMSRDRRGRGSRNAQCVPLRSEQWFIKSNLFEGGTRCEERIDKQRHNGEQTCGFQMCCLFLSFLFFAVELLWLLPFSILAT